MQRFPTSHEEFEIHGTRTLAAGALVAKSGCDLRQPPFTAACALRVSVLHALHAD